jgi:hypothetical protein
VTATAPPRGTDAAVAARAPRAGPETRRGGRCAARRRDVGRVVRGVVGAAGGVMRR